MILEPCISGTIRRIERRWSTQYLVLHMDPIHHGMRKVPSPYDDDEVISTIFHLFVTNFYGLYNINISLVPHLEGGWPLQKIVWKPCHVMMLEFKCEELILEMFPIFFYVSSESHPKYMVTQSNILWQLCWTRLKMVLWDYF